MRTEVLLCPSFVCFLNGKQKVFAWIIIIGVDIPFIYYFTLTDLEVKVWASIAAWLPIIHKTDFFLQNILIKITML